MDKSETNELREIIKELKKILQKLLAITDNKETHP